MQIKNRIIGKGHPVFIIGEAGVNHNGDFELARKMIDVAAKAGVDAIKFQTFKTEELILKNSPKAEYQKEKNNPDESFFDLLKRLEFSYEEFKSLKLYCEKLGIMFLSTPFDVESVNLLEKLNIDAYKIGSGDFDNIPLLKYIISKNKPILLSTGMSNMDEIKEIISFFETERYTNLALFQCTSLYPTPYDKVNLNVIKSFQKEFPNYITGFSDHSQGIFTGAIAVGLGAKIIEKHFTLDKKLIGPDHKASLNPTELSEFVTTIRNTELALGSSKKVIIDAEIEIKKVARKSIVSISEISSGEVLSEKNIGVKRPGTGISAKFYYNLLGKRVKKKILNNTLLRMDDLE